MSIDEMVLLLDFKNGSDSDLISFTQIALIRTKGVKEYEPVAPEVTTVETDYTAFLLAVSAAKAGGTEEKDIRDEKRLTLEKSLEALGNAIIANSEGNPLYVTDAGFKLRSDNNGRSYQPFEAPLWKELRRGILTGTLKGEVKSFPQGARGLLIEWRRIGEETYTTAKPSNGKRVELEGLPPMTKVEVRVMYFGTHGRTSNWSIPYPIEVL
ncbi:MAG: hypothetical protein IT258_02145 [Saprospiraceae bacterium]|nr:hypothetical protein [Saprospiraceae bacterium]